MLEEVERRNEKLSSDNAELTEHLHELMYRLLSMGNDDDDDDDASPSAAAAATAAVALLPLDLSRERVTELSGKVVEEVRKKVEGRATESKRWT